MLYTVIAYRWGWTNAHQYSAGVSADPARACQLAEELADDRGGKYGAAVYEWLDDTTPRLHKYFPSTYGEKAPFHNPRIEMFDSIGHAVHAAATTGTRWEAPAEGMSSNVPREAALPLWLQEVVRSKAHSSAFAVALFQEQRDRAEAGLAPLALGDKTRTDELWQAAGQEVDAELARAPGAYRDAVAMHEQRFGPVPPDSGPREAHLALDYRSLDHLLALVDEPARAICQRILAEHGPLFEQAPGSRHNHQAWAGGYLDHVVDCMNYARHLYAFDAALGRPMPFSLSDALLVLFLHDLEKPWRILQRADGSLANRPGFESKAEFRIFREQQLLTYGLALTPAQHNALAYVEGEGADYSSQRRVMNELAAFCHKVDVWSARQCHDYPKAEGDEWSGAGRFRTPPAG
jgi:hypothetical protein